MSATGNEVVTLSQLKEVYDSIVNKLPSAVTFSSSSNTSQNTPNNKLIKLSSVSGDTSLAYLSGNAIVITKQANYSLSGNVNLSTNKYEYNYKLFITIDNNQYVIKYISNGVINAPISLELGALNPNTIIHIYFGFTDYAQTGFVLNDTGSMFTLKTS